MELEKKSRLPIILGLVVLLVVAGGAVWYFQNRTADSTETPVTNEPGTIQSRQFSGNVKAASDSGFEIEGRYIEELDGERIKPNRPGAEQQIQPLQTVRVTVAQDAQVTVITRDWLYTKDEIDVLLAKGSIAGGAFKETPKQSSAKQLQTDAKTHSNIQIDAYVNDNIIDQDEFAANIITYYVDNFKD